MKPTAIIALLFLLAAHAGAQNDSLKPQVVAFVGSLSREQQQRMMFTFNDGERFRWHFVPMQRNGLPIGELSDDQRAALFDILKSSLSEQGFRKATGVIELESILRQVEGRSSSDSYRNPARYFVSIFGDPASNNPWGWRLEGHHLSLNFTTINGLLQSGTPSFLGANPAVVPSGPSKGHELLKDETHMAFALVNALSPEQLAIARFADRAPFDILSGNRLKAGTLEPAGIGYAKLTVSQQKMFMQLLDVYVKNYQFGFSSALMDKIRKAGIENLSFAWAGSLQPGAGHYYRIQGPMLLIEYDNTQNGANHVHSVVRDLTNDFAEDILLEHYEKEHKK